VADRELIKTLYAGHPLGRYPTIETVRNIQREDMVAFHQRYFHPDRTILAVAGDVKTDDLVKKLEALFAGWKKSDEPLPTVAAPAAEVPPQVLFARKEINQSAIRLGHLGIIKDNPDIYAIRVMDYILGGGFTSRLTTEIRSNQGLAYSVYSRFDVGRRFIVNAFIFGFVKPDAVVNQQARLEYYGYPPGFLENYRSNIAKVTKEDVLRVARKYLHPDAMVLSVVGRDTAFDKPLSTFGRVTEIKLDTAGNGALPK